MKKIMVMLMIAALAFCVGQAMAEEMMDVHTSGDWSYALLEDGTAEIVWYGGWDSKVEVPQRIDGHPVSKIGQYAFFSNAMLQTVIVPEGFISIGSRAFISCQNLRCVDLPDSLVEIGENAFLACTSLKEIDIPQGVVSIGDKAFQGCRSLESIVLPPMITRMGVNPFYGCIGLKDIRVSENNPVLHVEDGVLFDRKEQRLICYPLAATRMGYSIPEGTCVIGDQAFALNTSLRQVCIPDSIISIGENPFRGCDSLSDIHVSEGNPVLSVVEGVLYDRTENRLVFCTNESCEYEVTIPEGTRGIDEFAFSVCGRMKSVSIPDSVTVIGLQAFYGCEWLESVLIPGSVAEIGDLTFWGCLRLESVAFGHGVTTIGSSAFSGCKSLAAVTIPASVTLIEDDAFYDCSKLAALTVTPGSYAETWALQHGYEVDYGGE